MAPPCWCLLVQTGREAGEGQTWWKRSVCAAVTHCDVNVNHQLGLNSVQDCCSLCWCLKLLCFWFQHLDLIKFFSFWCVQVELYLRGKTQWAALLCCRHLLTFNVNMSGITAVCMYVHTCFLTLLFSYVCVCQGARVVVSRSFADFTPQATFDIKVPSQKSKTKHQTP